MINRKLLTRCRVIACDRPVLVLRSNLCGMHYQRLKKVGETGEASARRENHGLSKTPEYKSWTQAKLRCYSLNSPDRYLYGARGIKVCDRWLHSFENFLEDMGERPTPQHSLDRWPDINGSYEPSNCRWATKTEQCINQRMQVNNKTGYLGVSFHKKNRKWVARLTLFDKIYNLGSFTSAEEAAYIRDQAAIQIHKENAQLNFEYAL